MKNIKLAIILYFLFICINNISQVEAGDTLQSCYVGCKTCNKANSENSCTLCSEGRGDDIANEAIFNSCPCQNDYEDQLEETCSHRSSSYEAVRVISSILVIFLTVLIILLAMSGHHLLPFIIYDSFQLIGYLRMINIPLTGIMDNILDSLLKLNINILFGRALNFKEKMVLGSGQTSSQVMLDVPDQNIEVPTKLALIGYSYSFLYNMMTLIILYIVIASIISFFVIIQKCKRYRSGLIFLANQKRYTIIVRLITITVCEVIFNALLQLKKISFSNSFNQFSFFLTLISLIGLAVLVFFIIFAINWSIQVHEMSNPKYNTYFDKLKNKNTFNRNLICIQVFIKLLFISFIIVGLDSPNASLILLLSLYLVYVFGLGFQLSVQKFRIFIAYLALCFVVIVQIILLGIYQIYTDDIKKNQQALLAISWVFVITLILSLFLATFYAFAEFLSVIPTLLTYARQACKYLSSKDDQDEDDENGDYTHNNPNSQENQKDQSNNLELSLVARRKMASKTKKQSINQMIQGNNNNNVQWFDNPLNCKQENEIEMIQQSFQKQINFELNEKQRGSMVSPSRMSYNNENELQNKDL